MEKESSVICDADDLHDFGFDSEKITELSKAVTKVHRRFY